MKKGFGEKNLDEENCLVIFLVNIVTTVTTITTITVVVIKGMWRLLRVCGGYIGQLHF